MVWYGVVLYVKLWYGEVVKHLRSTIELVSLHTGITVPSYNDRTSTEATYGGPLFPCGIFVIKAVVTAR